MMKPDSINISLSQLKYGEADSQQCLGHEVMKVLHSQKNLKSYTNAMYDIDVTCRSIFDRSYLSLLLMIHSVFYSECNKK